MEPNYQYVYISYQQFSDVNWVTYEREFHQQAAASAISEWSILDNTLWNLARQSTSYPSKTQFTTYPPSDPSVLSNSI